MASSREEIAQKATAFAGRGRYKRALSLYLKAGDDRGAGSMHEKLGRPDLAIECYSRAGEFTRAAELLTVAGDHEKAALMFAKSGAPSRASNSLVDAGKFIDAAKMSERAGELEEAAKLYERGGRFGIAADLYARCGMRDKAIQIYEDNGRKELAARLCAEAGEHARAAALYSEMEIYTEAARSYLLAEMKEEAIDAFDKAQSYGEAVSLCEELGLYERAAQFCERMGDTERAVDLFAKADKFVEAGRIYEEKRLYFQAARMYARGKDTLSRAAELFSHTFSVDPVLDHEAASAVWDIAVAESSGRIVLGLAGAEVVVLDKQGAFLWRFRIPMGVRCRSVAITPDASRLAVGTEGRSVYMLDASNRMLWKRELGGEVRGLAFADDAKMIVAGCTDGYIRVLDIDSKDLWTYQTEFKVWHLAVNDAKRHIVAGSGDGKLYVLDYFGQVVWKENAEDWISRVALSPNGQYCALVLGQDLVRIYDLDDRRILREHKNDCVVQDICFWDDKSLVVCTNNEAMIWDLDCRVLCREPSTDRVMRARCGTDGETIYLGHFENGLQVVRVHDCIIRAARCYEECKDYLSAARMYESKNELTSAAKMYAKAGNYQQAAELAEQLGNHEQAGDYYDKAGEYEKAAQRFEEVHLFERAAACYDKAGLKQKAGELLAGLGDTVRAAQLQLESGNFIEAGLLFQQAGALNEAEAAYDEAAKANVLTPAAAVGLGRIYLGSGRLDQAVKFLQPFRKDPDHGNEVVVLLAECFVKKNQYNLAAEHFREALTGFEDHVAEHIDTFYGLASAYESAGQLEEAKGIYKKILLVDYYYKDVTGRLEKINEISSIFHSGDSQTNMLSRAGATGARGAQATMAPTKPRRYEIVRKLGEGGMGVVYEARDTKLDRIVALKILPSKFKKTEDLKSRFLREARAVAALSHANVVAVYDIGEEWGESYIAMEYVDGSTLRDFISKKKKLSIKQTMKYAGQIAEGLAAAHRAGIIHRDIKPENVMVAKASDQVKIMDFGLARMDSASNLTQEGSVMGTWRYMAPEQVRGDKVSAAADVYSTGIMLFEMIAGEPPFTEGDLAYHQVNTIPAALKDVLPGVPEELSDIVARCLAKKASDRFADGQELVAALESVPAQNR